MNYKVCSNVNKDGLIPAEDMKPGEIAQVCLTSTGRKSAAHEGQYILRIDNYAMNGWLCLNSPDCAWKYDPENNEYCTYLVRLLNPGERVVLEGE